MAQLFSNNAFSSLAASLTNAATTLTVSTGHGDRFPVASTVNGNFFLLTLQDASNNVEIVKVTERTAGADAMTIVRAREGLTARSWNIGDVVELRVTSFALGPLKVFAGASTAQTMRAAMETPSWIGENASGTWAIGISGNAATATLATNAVNATTATTATTATNAVNATNAATATALQTGRSFTIGSTSKTFTGTSNVSWSLAEIGAMPIAGGQFAGPVSTRDSFGNTNTTSDVGLEVRGSTFGAVMSFYRFGNYAINMGLDSDNVFRLGGRSAAAARLQMDMSGNLTMAGNVTAFSDERLKKDWAAVAPNFLERLIAVKRGTYTRTDNGERQAGVSAQDFFQILPEVVQKDAAGFLSLAYGNAALLSVVELTTKVLDLEKRLIHLEAR